ncbi:YEATS-associated helix-containing protein [Propionivibrio sp.]|jgi:DNA-binding transcriptional ArsR family regulator|uniref:YEATS-associated helix-containing protein n=1 Tax=Propionivibrio sp. TaxID=2212460 RepID=UPI002626ED88|nr:YEATS-associated helix-containing protein [Propionivibrio sp.]
MNPELQKSLQVTALPSTLDSYMLMILLIMVAAGILGGVANYFLSERQNEVGRREWGKYPILGVIAALTVPLFLNMISSNLLEAARTRPVDFFVFAGFCLIYVVASRRVFENVANKLLNQMDQMKRDMVQIKQQRQETTPPPAPREEALPPPPDTLTALKPEVVRESLSYNDIEILRALAEENYVYGNLVGLTDKTGLARDLVSTRLTVLKNLGIIETRINDKNVLHWYVSPRGKQMLGDILSGQEDR